MYIGDVFTCDCKILSLHGNIQFICFPVMCEQQQTANVNYWY